MDKKYVKDSAENPLKKGQLVYFRDKSIDAYRTMLDVSLFLAKQEILITHMVVAVRIPDAESRVVILANPGIKPDALRELIKTLGDSAEEVVFQSQTIREMSNMKAYYDQENKRDECEKRDECFESDDDEGVTIQ